MGVGVSRGQGRLGEREAELQRQQPGEEVSQGRGAVGFHHDDGRHWKHSRECGKQTVT